MRSRVLIGFLLSLVLLIGGGATAVGANHQRSVTLRGWTDASQMGDLPTRVPLAGVNVELAQYDASSLARELDAIAAAGFTWVRQTFLWSDIEPSQGQFDFSRYDALVQAVAARPSLRLVAVLDGAPAWARRVDASDRLFAPPASMAAFGKFAGQMAGHYVNQLDYYQIWDEPNLNTHWGGLDPQPADYAAMLKAAYPAIHGHNPNATVIAAALAPTVETGPHNLSDVLYLRALYDVGAADSFDAAAGKPYGFNSSPQDRLVSQDVLNFSHIILLREEMVKHGDGNKALWGSNFGWNHLPDGWSGPPSIWGQVSATDQRDYTRQAYERAELEWPWMGGLILEHWAPAAPADDPIQGFAVSKVAADWFQNGQFFAHPTLDTGLHDPHDSRVQAQGTWRFGPLGADVQQAGTGEPPEDGSDHKLTFSFEGTALAFKVRRGDYVAFLYITVDGQPANALPQVNNSRRDAYILLKSPDPDVPGTDLILAAKDLPSGNHTAEVRAYLGYDHWELAGIAVATPPDTRRFDLIILLGALAVLLGATGLVLTGRRIPWPGSPETITAYVRRMADVLGGIAVSLLAMIGMFLTWGGLLPDIFRRDPPALLLTALTAGLVYFSPAFIITVVALIVLWFIIYNRPVIGLALILFWAPMFLFPVQLYLSALPMVEVCLLLTFTAVVAHSVVTWKPHRLSRPTWYSLAPMDWALLAFVALATVTLLWSEQRSPAIREWRTMVLEPALFYLLFRWIRPSGRDLVRLVDVLLLSGTVVALIGLYLYFRADAGVGIVIAEQGSRRLSSVYGSPNNAALFLGRCIPFGIAMFLIAPGALRKLTAAVVTVIMGIAVLLTQSGGAILLGVPAALICVLLFWNWQRGLIATGVVGMAMALVLLFSRFIPRLQGLLDLSRSTSFARTQVWISAVNLLRERPILGAGLDQFLYLYRSRYILPDAWREPDLSHPHNFVLDYWISLGILGLVVLVALQVIFWRNALSAWRSWRAKDALLTAVVVGAMGCMADFLTHGFVDNSYFVVDLAFVFCFTAALVTRLVQLGKEHPELAPAVGQGNEPQLAAV